MAVTIPDQQRSAAGSILGAYVIPNIEIFAFCTFMSEYGHSTRPCHSPKPKILVFFVNALTL